MVFNTQEEYDFIRESQKTLSNNAPYWIGDSTNQPCATFNYSLYIGNNSGIHID